MWLIAEYEAVTLFSLRLGTATASGGKTLLVPTPYALKMALLDAACRTLGLPQAEALWVELRDLRVALQPARQAVVTNLFQKVLRPRRTPVEMHEPDAGPFQKTIGYREYAQLVGSLGVALGWQSDETPQWLAGLLLQVNYLGKRGGFMQLVTSPRFANELPAEFVETTSDQTRFAFNGTLQTLDDCAPTLTFAMANIYSGEKVKLGKDRIFRNIVLPYRLTRSSKSFSLYERIT